MLKPLLRTLPTLSGNVKIGCTLSDYNKITNTEYTAYVRIAKLLPLTSSLSQRNCDVNLLYSTYDYDLQRFYKYYSSYFYDDVFEYNKSDYILIDKSEAQKNRNTDFEFGCKRISYLKNDKQFAFYAPIYVESINDIPDYFKIKITLTNEKYSIEKNIRVMVNSENTNNYLSVYIKRYLEKLDFNVIFCNINSKQAVYYGIDLIKGGFTKTVDNIINKVFSKQNTINNFDAVVTNGFQRNNLVIRQILPLAWYFNVNDILSEEDQIKFKNSRVYISGAWYKNGEPVNFYNIDTNYEFYYESPYLINKKNGMFLYRNSLNNIMNMQYPSLNESLYTGYRYSNKLNIKYNRWKMKYSSDEHPYITNLSPAFSMNQGSIYKYGGFPEKYYPLEIISDSNNNLIIPIGNALTDKTSPYINNYSLTSNYLATLNNNVSTWYTLVNSIDNIFDKDIWENVQDNKVYYKGILYDFSKIYEHYPELTKKIDKFSVIVNLHFNPLSNEELLNINKADISIFNSIKYRTDKTAWTSERLPEGFSSGNFNKLPLLFNTTSSFGSGNSQLVFDKLYKKAENCQGDFIDLLSLGYNIYDINIFYKYTDIVTNFCEDEEYLDDIVDKLTKNGNYNNYFVDGFELLPIYKLNNILHENNKDILFEGKDSASWILDKLYFSQHGNYYKTKYDRDTFKKLLKDCGDQKRMVPLYLSSKFISKANFISMLYEIYGKNYTRYQNIIDKLFEYEYYPRIKDEKSATYAADVYIQKDKTIGQNYGNYIPKDKIEVDNDVIYVDPFNLNNVIENYNKRFPEKQINPLPHTSERNFVYAKFLNMKHLLFYVSELYKNENAEEDILKLVNSLYIRKRVIIGTEKTENVKFRDYYIPVLNLYDKFRLLSQKEKLDIINSDFKAETQTQTNNSGDGEVIEEIIVNDTTDLENSAISNPAGIYKKINNTVYSPSAYKLSSYNEIIPAYWLCNAYTCKHTAWVDDSGRLHHGTCAKPDEGGTYFYKYKMVEYHDEDFYYKPIFYVKDISGDTEKYILVSDYIKTVAILNDPSLLEYLNDELVDILLNNEISDLNIQDLPFGNGRHESMNPIGFDMIDLTDNDLYEQLVELKKEIERIIPLIKTRIYYKVNRKEEITSEQFVKYENFTGVNEYILLDDKQLKKDIINGISNIVTYVIDKNGKFIEKDYDTPEYYIARTPNDPDYIDYVKETLSTFLGDLVYHEDNNYFTMSSTYNNSHDLDAIMNIPDLNGSFKSDFTFEIVYFKDFVRLDSNLFGLLNIEDNKYPFKDLYLYRIYKEDEYPSSVRMYYSDNESNISNSTSLSHCVYPLFNDILLQEKKYTVIYSAYNQSNIYKVKTKSDSNYRYNLSDTICMYDISDLPYDKEYVVKYPDSTKNTYCYTYNYYWELKNNGDPRVKNHEVLPTYNLINNCYSNIIFNNDYMNIYNDFNINTYLYTSKETYTYTYLTDNIETIYKHGSYQTVINQVENQGTGIREVNTTYGFILMDAYIDNTNSSFNIVDTEYKKKKYFTYVNEHDIYDPGYNILDTFNLLVPFSKINLLDNLFNFNDIIQKPNKIIFNTYYKQTPLINDDGYTYAYDINMKGSRIDTLTLQRYFDSIVPYIPQTNIIDSTYCLKYKNYKYPVQNINYIDDIFYSQNINIYNYNKIRVYDSKNSYTLFEPIEYKHLNDNKLINLQENFFIEEPGVFTYEELIELEKEEYTLNKFKNYVLKDKLNHFNDSEILFLYNRYKINYDTECIGLNSVKTKKLYKLTYKFTLL